MQQVSFSKASLGGRWSPGPAASVTLRGWTPRRTVAVPRRALSAAPGRQLGQQASLAETGLSMTTSAATALTGFGLAFMGGKHTTWRWIGAFAGTLGAMRLLHDLSKV